MPDTPKTRMALATAASVVLHLAVLFRAGVFAPAPMAAGGGYLQVRLLAPAVSLAHGDVQQAVLPEEVRPPQSPSVLPPPRQPSADSGNPRAVSETGSRSTPAEPAATTVGAAPERQAQQAVPALGVPTVGRSGALRYVEFDIELFSGPERQSAGKARHRYFAENGDLYGISVEQMSGGGMDDGRPGWQIEISGNIRAQGLSPSLFETKGREGDELISLKDSAQSASLLPGEVRKGRMRDGVLDRQSLMYQFMLVPPKPGGGTLSLTDGDVHRQYAYRSAGFESMSVAPMGEMRTMKLVVSAADGGERIELWLMPDVHYLPARMRHIDGAGKITEHVVQSLRYR